jgi:hypothetical protein
VNQLSVLSVTHYESGYRTVSVECKCAPTNGKSVSIHDVVWPSGTSSLDGELPCGLLLLGLTIPKWCFDARHRTGYGQIPEVHERRIRASTAANGNNGASLNDNAIDHPELNWIE